ncbi:MAG: hypothetical protein ACT443_08775 [Gemmatimonadota bacterium]
MKLDTLLRAAQILRSQPAYAMPLARLHARLAEEFGGEAGSYARMYQELKKRPQSFMVLDSPRLVEDDRYDDLLEGTGLGACTRVALAEAIEEEAPGALNMAGATLAELWPKTEADPVLREYLAQAMRELEAISAAAADGAPAHPTTPARDPRP